MSEYDDEFCMYSLHTTGWEYDLYNACGERPIRLFSTTERKRCKRCGRKMMFVPEPIKPTTQSLVERLRNEGSGFASDHALEAADAIEALVKERDGARAERDQADRDRAQATMGRAELLLRAEKAEAEVKRLTAALHSITLSYEERCGIDHATLARSALEAKP